jgi:hypothetical protein
MLSLVKNKNDDVLISFLEDQKSSINCISSDFQIQKAFILACIEKYKQITFLKSNIRLEKLDKINKHYYISNDYFVVQKSYLKFLKEKLEKSPAEILTYDYIINTLS